MSVDRFQTARVPFSEGGGPSTGAGTAMASGDTGKVMSPRSITRRERGERRPTDEGRHSFPAPAARVEAVGLLCPIPITRTARAMRDLQTGDVLEIRADDRVVLIDLPNWCRSWRHVYLGHEERGSVLHLFVRKQGSTA